MRTLSIWIAAALFLGCSAEPAPQKAAVRVAIAQEVSHLTPYSAAMPDTLLELVYDKLAAPSPYLNDAQPWLAESIVPEGDDGRNWRIRLRDGIRWHDGRPFGADDVAFTFRYFRDGPVNRWTHHTNDTPALVVIEVLDRLSLRIQCKAACPHFNRVTAADVPILPAHLWQGVQHPHRYGGPAIGTGPYRLVALASGRYLRLEANRDYFAGMPRVDGILISTIRNPATAFAALLAGELDLVSAPVPPELVHSLSQQPGLALLQGNPFNAVEMRINFERPPFSDPAFRHALALALQPNEVLTRVVLGQGLSGNVGYPHPESPWTASNLSQASDPAAAATRLDELGFLDRDGDGWREDPSGSPLRFSIKVSSSEPLHLRAAQVVARQYEALGILLRVEAVDPARHRAFYSNRQFDLMINEMGPHGLADPDQLAQSFRSGYLWRAGLPYLELDRLLGDWQRATSASIRTDAGFALQRFHNQAPTTMVLYYPHAYWAYRPQAFSHWRTIPGQGLFHKWSLITPSPSIGLLP